MIDEHKELHVVDVDRDDVLTSEDVRILRVLAQHYRYARWGVYTLLSIGAAAAFFFDEFRKIFPHKEH